MPTAEGYLIRRATRDDADGILACLHSAFKAYQDSYTPGAFSNTVLDHDRLRQRLDDMTVFVAVKETGEVVGTITCTVLDAQEGHLRGMAVRTELHGCGIAQQLLTTAERKLQEQGCSRVTLDTTEPLRRAVSFYEKNGYRSSGGISDFFGMKLIEYVKIVPPDRRYTTKDRFEAGAVCVESGVEGQDCATARSDEMTVGVLLFDDVEVLDFAGPLEVFFMAGQVSNLAIKVVTVGARMDPAHPIVARSGLRLIPDYPLADAPRLHILVVPGGQGVRCEVSNSQLIEWIRVRAGQALLTSSVCTGAFLLAAAGLLDGRSATTHAASLQRLRDSYPRVNVRSDVRFVDEGAIVTAAGVSAGIDMALHIVCRLGSLEVAKAVAQRMEYTVSELEHRN